MENTVVEQNKKKNLIIGVMACVIILLVAALVYFLFIKNDNDPAKPQDSRQVDGNNIVAKKKLRTFYFDVILDENSNAFLAVRDDDDGNVDVDDKLTQKFNSAPVYNYNNKEVKLLKVDLQNIKDIQKVPYGNGGGNYIIFLNQNDKLYALIEFDVMETADITPLTDNSLNKVSKVYPECDEGGCLVYADAILNGKTEKISLYDLFEKDNSQKNDNSNLNQTEKITYLKKHSLNKNKELAFTIGKNIFKIKNTNGKLYFNGKYIEDASDSITLYETNKFIIIAYEWQNPHYAYIINENGKLIKIDNTINKSIEEYGLYGYDDLRLENGHLVATISYFNEYEDGKAEFVYEIDKMTIKEINQ